MTEFDADEYSSICSYERKRISRLPINDQYQQQFTYNGRVYYYDPDFDCFYPHVDWSELSYWDRYGWLYVTAILTILCFYVSQ